MIQAFVLFVVLPTGLVLMWAFSGRRARWRWQIRSSYTAQWLPFQYRIFIANLPIWAFGLACIGLVLIVPRDLWAWVAVGWAGIFMAALSLGYWAHLRLMPGWLRDEVLRGEIEPPTPDRWDWLLYWFFAFGALSVVILALVHPLGT